ncbi:hypothetical protein BKA80DRAFT_134684 [Phyllosticta citrichinensis]
MAFFAHLHSHPLLHGKPCLRLRAQHSTAQHSTGRSSRNPAAAPTLDATGSLPVPILSFSCLVCNTGCMYNICAIGLCVHPTMQSRAICPPKRCVPAAAAAAAAARRVPHVPCVLRPAPTSPKEPSSFRLFAIVAMPGGASAQWLLLQIDTPGVLGFVMIPPFQAFDLHALKKETKTTLWTVGAFELGTQETSRSHNGEARGRHIEQTRMSHGISGAFAVELEQQCLGRT